MHHRSTPRRTPARLTRSGLRLGRSGAPGAQRAGQHCPDRPRAVGPRRLRGPGGTPFVGVHVLRRPRAPRGPPTSDSPVVMGQDGPVTSSAPSRASARPYPAQPSTSAAASPRPAPAPAARAGPGRRLRSRPPSPPRRRWRPRGRTPGRCEAPARRAGSAPAPAPAPWPPPRLPTPAPRARCSRWSTPSAPPPAAAPWPPIRRSPRVARAHSADMRDRDFFDHVNPDGLDPFDRAERAGLTRGRRTSPTGSRTPPPSWTRG